jgi:hypothetical protein
MKYLLIIASLLCSVGYSIFRGIKQGQESAITKYYLFSTSKGKEEVTLDYFNSVESYRKKLFGSEVVFNSEAAYVTRLTTFSFLLIFIGTVVFAFFVFDMVKKSKNRV